MTTITYDIERRESGCSTWNVFHPDIKDEVTATDLVELYQEQIPNVYHFRLYKVTTTKELIQ